MSNRFFEYRGDFKFGSKTSLLDMFINLLADLNLLSFKKS